MFCGMSTKLIWYFFHVVYMSDCMHLSFISFFFLSLGFLRNSNSCFIVSISQYRFRSSTFWVVGFFLLLLLLLCVRSMLNSANFIYQCCTRSCTSWYWHGINTTWTVKLIIIIDKYFLNESCIHLSIRLPLWSAQ